MIKILFVDDNFDCLKILERVFRKEFIVYTTSGVNAAMEILKNKKVNLVCSDLHMRGETGVILLQEMIRSDMNIPFILMSGDIDSMEIKRAESYGAVFLEKNGELASRIKRIAVSVEKKGSQAIGGDASMRKKILIADDEADIVSMLRAFFESKGYFVLSAVNGTEALKQVEQEPDIILLDINMPGLDGLKVCERIRDYVSCPILFLTARIEDTDKVKGFAVGGDDYIVKPFSLMELEARVTAHLRREARRTFDAQIKFSGDLTVDYSERCLFFEGQRLGLAKKEFDIVELLSQNPGQVFTKERIYERIWGYDSMGDSSVVAEHIRRIRSKIAAYTDRAYIETVWGCGYKWRK